MLRLSSQGKAFSAGSAAALKAFDCGSQTSATAVEKPSLSASPDCSQLCRKFPCS